MFVGTNGVNGVCTISKVEPELVVHGFPIHDTDSEEDIKMKELFNSEGRLLTTMFNKFTLINACKLNNSKYGEKKVSIKSGHRIPMEQVLRHKISASCVL